MSFTPGKMYVEVYDEDGGEESFGLLGWYCSDGNFYDVDTGELIYLDGDSLLEQDGCFCEDYVG